MAAHIWGRSYLATDEAGIRRAMLDDVGASCGKVVQGSARVADRHLNAAFGIGSG